MHARRRRGAVRGWPKPWTATALGVSEPCPEKDSVFEVSVVMFVMESYSRGGLAHGVGKCPDPYCARWSSMSFNAV